MVFRYEKKIVIKQLYQKRGLRGIWIVKDHPEFEWKLGGVQTFLRKIDETSVIETQEGYGRPKTVRTEENIEAVQEMIPSQDEQSGTNSTGFLCWNLTSY